MKKRWILLVFLMLMPISYGQCVEPEGRLEISEDTVLCPGNFTIDRRIIVGDADNIEIRCEGTTINCLIPIVTGIRVKDSDNVTVTGCSINDCQHGISLYRSGFASIINNSFQDNMIGIAVEKSHNASITGNIISGRGMSISAVNSVIDKAALTENNEIEREPRIIEHTLQKEEEKEKPLPEILEKQEKQVEVVVETVYITEDEARGILAEEIKLRKKELSDIQVSQGVEYVYKKYFNITQRYMEINRTVTYDRGVTRIKLTVMPKRTLYNFSLYEKIPKCFADHIEELVFLGKDYEVIEADPLVMWQFGAVDKETSIEYYSQNKLSRDCLDLFGAFGMSRGIEGVIMIDEERAISRALVDGLIAIGIVLLVVFLRGICRTKK